MTDFAILHFVWLFCTVIGVWGLPRKLQLDAIALSTMLFLCFFSPWSCVWLLASSLVVYIGIRYPEGKKAMPVVITSFLLFGVFCAHKWASSLVAGELHIPLMLGLAYYTCRHIHILMEAYKGNIPSMSVRQYLHYQLFLPVVVAGPIHRYQNFSRQCERRRWSVGNVTGGLERVLYGYAKVVVLGNYLISLKLGALLERHASGTSFWEMFLTSGKDWAYLYSAFSGYTDVAVGFSFLLGIRIEENFDNPLKAKNLIDFWRRWHITLSGWCRDYIFAPVQARIRNQLIAVLAAMVVMGIWHEFSLYYFLWGVYHAVGISLCRLYQLKRDPFRLSSLPTWIQHAVTGGATFAWLVAGRPVIVGLLAVLGLGECI